jgi:hypothetical protein
MTLLWEMLGCDAAATQSTRLCGLYAYEENNIDFFLQSWNLDRGVTRVLQLTTLAH